MNLRKIICWFLGHKWFLDHKWKYISTEPEFGPDIGWVCQRCPKMLFPQSVIVEPIIQVSDPSNYCPRMTE